MGYSIIIIPCEYQCHFFSGKTGAVRCVLDDLLANLDASPGAVLTESILQLTT